jgi:hypothetical protein
VNARQVRLVRAAIRLCVKIAPASRRDWVSAMEAEAASIREASGIGAFALGCIFACCMEKAFRDSPLWK